MGLLSPRVGFPALLESCFLLDTSEDWRLVNECDIILQDKGTPAAKLGSYPRNSEPGEEGLTLSRDFAGL